MGMTEAKDACEITERKTKIAAMIENIKYQNKDEIINALSNSNLSIEDIESMMKDIAKSNELTRANVSNNNNNNNEQNKGVGVGVY